MRDSSTFGHLYLRGRSSRGLAMLVTVSSVLLAAALINHETESWRVTLDTIDGPLVAGLLIWGVAALRSAFNESRMATATARLAEARYARLFRDAPIALFRATPDGAILDANPALHALIGVPPGESLVGTNAASLYANPDDQATVLKAVRDGTLGSDLTVQLRRRDGAIVWVIAKSRVVTDPVTGAQVIEGGLTDVTERRLASRRMEASERRFRALTEKSTDGVTMFGRDGIVKYRSEGALRLIGRTDAVRGESYLERVHPADRGATFEVVRRVIDEPGASRTAQLRLRRGDDSWMWVEARFTNLLDEPNVESVVINFRDITDRVQAEVALRESEERFRQIAETIKDAFFVIDTSTDAILYISGPWKEIWGRPIEEGYDPVLWFNAIHADDRAAMIASQSLVKSGQANEVAFRVVRPDGVVRWVRGRSFPVRNAQGEVYRCFGVAEDVTELRQAEERFAQAQKMEAIGRLAGGVAHDFNNLLTVIIAEADFTMANLSPGSEEQESLANIRSATDKAAALTRQLLLFSRKQLAEPVTFNLNEAVAETGKLLRRTIGEDIHLEIDTGAEAGLVLADRGQIEQVLTNLAVNARDAMPDGGLLAIETRTTSVGPGLVALGEEVRPGAYVVLSVRDTGTGMTPEVIEHAFEPFYTTKALGKGTGLGLATCHGIVKQAGGHILVSSKVGAGTTFTIYLPQVAAPVQTPEMRRATPHGTETVMLVEDESSVRRVAARILRAQGYTVLEAGDSTEALMTLKRRTGPLDLLLTDVVLPGMGGRDLADAVSSMHNEARVLFTTGYTDDTMLHQRLLARDVELLAKPYSKDSLAHKVRDVLDAPVPALTA